METHKKYNSGSSGLPAKKKPDLFILLNILLLIILPLLSILLECYFDHVCFGWAVAGKWFLFWAMGIRLFTAGISQCSNPAFTARILNLRSEESFIVIRELGFANISLGVMGILSVINDNWRSLAAVCGGLFFGLAAIQHILRKPENKKEFVAMLGDSLICIFLILYLVCTRS
jgi:hypothetical protein